MSWFTTLRTWWDLHFTLCQKRRALRKRDPQVRRELEEFGQRKRK